MTEENKPKQKKGFACMTPEQLKAAQDKGHQAKIENNKRRRTLKEELEILLENGDIQKRMSLVLIDRILNNGRDAVRAYEVIRDTLGEKPVERVETKLETSTINITIDDDDKS